MSWRIVIIALKVKKYDILSHNYEMKHQNYDLKLYGISQNNIKQTKLSF